MGTDNRVKLLLYKQIYNALSEEIRSGVYKEKGALPGEHSLCARFGVERVTVRKSLRMLVDDGLIRRVPGVGSLLVDDEDEKDPPDQDAYDGRRGLIRGSQFKESPQPPNNTVLLVSREDYLQTSNGEHYHFRLICGFEKRISDNGHNLMIKSLGETSNLANIINQAAPAAIIFDSYVEEARYWEALNAGIICVSVNHYTPLMTSIVSNNFDGAYQVTKMLTEQGHEKIAFITGREKYQTNIERMSGVQRLYILNSKTLDKKYLINGNY